MALPCREAMLPFCEVKRCQVVAMVMDRRAFLWGCDGVLNNGNAHRSGPEGVGDDRECVAAAGECVATDP